MNAQVVTDCLQLESVRRIFDEHRRQDISMIQERDEHHRGTAQEEDENYLDCHWVFDSNLCRELHRCAAAPGHCVSTHWETQPKYGGCSGRICGKGTTAEFNLLVVMPVF